MMHILCGRVTEELKNAPCIKYAEMFFNFIEIKNMPRKANKRND